MNDDTKEKLFGQIRLLLMALAAWLAGKGYLPADVGGALIGVIMFVLPMAWSLWAQRQQEAKTQARETIAVQAGIQRAQERPVVEPVVLKSDAQEIIKNYGPTAADPADKPKEQT